MGSEAFFVNAHRMQPRSYDLCAGFGPKESETASSSQCPWHEGVAYRLVRSATRHHNEVLHHDHRLIKTVCFSFDRYIRGSSVIRVSNDVHLERQLKTRKKTVRIVMAMTVAFFISWSPYALSSLIGSIMGRESVSPAYSMIPELMAKASVVYNPILYAFLNSRFRITLLNLCNCSTNRVGNASTESSDLSFPDSATGGVEMRRRGVPVHQ